MGNEYDFKIPGATVHVTVTPDVAEAPVVEAPVEATEVAPEAPVEETPEA